MNCGSANHSTDNALQIPRYEDHTKLPQWSYQIWIWYDHVVSSHAVSYITLAIIIIIIISLSKIIIARS